MTILKLENPHFTNTKKIDGALLCNKVPFKKKDFEYFIGHEDDSEKIITLCIMPPKMSAYRKNLTKLNICLFWYKITNC